MQSRDEWLHLYTVCLLNSSQIWAWLPLFCQHPYCDGTTKDFQHSESGKDLSFHFWVKPRRQPASARKGRSVAAAKWKWQRISEIVCRALGKILFWRFYFVAVVLKPNSIEITQRALKINQTKNKTETETWTLLFRDSDWFCPGWSLRIETFFFFKCLYDGRNFIFPVRFLGLLLFLFTYLLHVNIFSVAIKSIFLFC